MVGEVPVRGGGRDPGGTGGGTQNDRIGAAIPGHLRRGVGERVRKVTVVVGVPAAVSATALSCLRHHVIVLHNRAAHNVYAHAGRRHSLRVPSGCGWERR